MKVTRGMHNRLRNKERENFRRCLIQGYIFLSGREEVARDKTVELPECSKGRRPALLH